MHRHDEMTLNKSACKGRIRGYFFDPETGEQLPSFEINNVTTYIAADILARLLGGDQSYRVSHVGFIYGPNATPSPIEEPPTSRTQTWSALSTSLADPSFAGNILLSSFTAAPLYKIDGDPSYYDGNQVTLNAHTGNRVEYGFPNVAPYADILADGDYIYHAMLIARRELAGGAVEYLPYARATLIDGATYPQKPVGYELALYWDVSFF